MGGLDLSSLFRFVILGLTERLVQGFSVRSKQDYESTHKPPQRLSRAFCRLISVVANKST